MLGNKSLTTLTFRQFRLRMRTLLISLVVLLTATATALAQQKSLVTPQQKANLEQIGREARQKNLDNYKAALQIATETQAPINFTTSDGSQVRLFGLGPAGELLYIGNDNVGLAIANGTIHVQKGGRLGLDNTGRGLAVGVWEVGRPTLDHQEYAGRVSQKDGSSDGISTHANHVIGTIAAAGVNPIALGMAPEATIWSYDAGEFISEITEAAANGLLLSNHSWGNISGWNDGTWYGDPDISDVEDYKFGFYNSTSAALDNIARNAPFHLTVKSSGNDNGDSGDGRHPADGNAGAGYDAVGTWGTAKNILTVGAVEDLNGYTTPGGVQMSNFSSWGPTDDGRIKPDIVGNGVSVLSAAATAPDAYSTLQGTSMAAPGVTGSMLLLQQMYSRLHRGNFMYSSTLKALVIHTAFEAGTANGPDYRFGWGLINTEGAANHILLQNNSTNVIAEDTLQQGQLFTRTIESDGFSPLKVTIAWIDPAGTPVAPALDPEDLMLVNDLDLRIIGPDGTEYLPWILDPSRPSNRAQRGDNFRDNVEQVEILTPAAGLYTIQVKHKGNLMDGEQGFSLIANSTPFLNTRNTFFWEGGDGEWNDPENWSNSFRDNTEGLLPGPTDRVVIGSESVTEEGQRIKFTEPVEVFSFTYSGDSTTVLDMQNFDLKVHSHFILNNELIVEEPGTFEFLEKKAKKAIFSMRAKAEEPLSILFKGPTTDWQVEQDTASATLDLTVADGGLSLFDENYRIRNISVGGSSSFYASNAEIYDLNSLIVSPAATTYVENFSLNFTPTDQEGLLSFTDAQLQQLNLIQGALRVENSNLSAQQVKINGSFKLNDSAIFDSLELSEGSSLALAEGVELVVSSNFTATGSSESPIQIISENASSPAVITADVPYRYCFDWLEITNVSTAGNTLFVGGNNTSYTNTNGWEQADCDELIFAQIGSQYNCANAGTELFLNNSTGSYTNIEWNISGPGVSDTFEGVESPVVYLPSANNFQVEVTLSNTEETFTSTQTITIQDNPLPDDLTIEVFQDDQLFVTVDASRFQWYKNGEAIPGATSRIITPDQSGTYYVEVFNNSCRTRSNEYEWVILSADDPENGYLLLYPNPVQNELVLHSNNVWKMKHLQVINIQGQVLINESVNTGAHPYILPVHQLERGIYIIDVLYNDGSYSRQRFVKE